MFVSSRLFGRGAASTRRRLLTKNNRNALLLTANNGLLRTTTTTASSSSLLGIGGQEGERIFSRSRSWIGAAAAAGIVTAAALTTTNTTTTKLDNSNDDDEDSQSNLLFPEAEPTTLLNWSGTHEVQTDQFYEPESLSQLEALVHHCHLEGLSLRPVGSSLSPNGIGFSSKGMVSIAQLDKIINVDVDKKEVTVQAGCRVSGVIEELRKYNLTLPNLASIAEQQMGGFVSVGAHGTGATIGPVDRYVTSVKVVTPGMGTLTLTREEHGELFHLVKVGLGCLGILAEITMECIPAHNLVEHTYVFTRKEAREQLQTLLKEHKHVRYMWIPYTDSVVVVTNDPEDSKVVQHRKEYKTVSNDEKLKPFCDLLIQELTTRKNISGIDDIPSMGFDALRDVLLALDPLNVQHVKKVNAAEAEFWKLCTGYQTKPSDQLLQFDCGGQQWVKEVVFPTGTLSENNHNDINFMEKLLTGIEDEQSIPAHSPIEQRWSSSSSSLMSPVYDKNCSKENSVEEDTLHSWVGIIMYLPPADEEDKNSLEQRKRITDRFKGTYCDLLRTVGQEVNYATHWAKLELPTSMWQLIDLQVELQQRYPLELFKKAREILDPKGILGNSLVNLAFGTRPRKPTIPMSVYQNRNKKKQTEPTTTTVSV